MSTARTADGVEVKAGDTVWISDAYRVLTGSPVSYTVGRYPDGELGASGDGAICPLARAYSTRLACLLAARARAAAEVERLSKEIEKEKANG